MGIRRTTCAAVALTCGLALAACGQAAQTSTTSSPTRLASSTSAAASPSPSPTMDGAASQELIGTWSTAVTAAKSVHSDSTTTGDAGKTSTVAQVQLDQQLADIAETTSAGTTRTIYVDGQAYRQDPATAPKWAGIMRQGTQPLIERATGIALLRQLHGSVTSIQPAGPETLNGQSTQRYAVLVDAAAFYREMGQTWSGTATELTFTVWVTSDGLPVQIRSEVGHDKTVSTYEWNVPVTVTAPTDLVG